MRHDLSKKLVTFYLIVCISAENFAASQDNHLFPEWGWVQDPVLRTLVLSSIEWLLNPSSYQFNPVDIRDHRIIRMASATKEKLAQTKGEDALYLERAWPKLIKGKGLSEKNKVELKYLRPVILRMYFQDVLNNKDLWIKELQNAMFILPDSQDYRELKLKLRDKFRSLQKLIPPSLLLSSSMDAPIPATRPSSQRSTSHTSSTRIEPNLNLPVLGNGLFPEWEWAQIFPEWEWEQNPKLRTPVLSSIKWLLNPSDAWFNPFEIRSNKIIQAAFEAKGFASTIVPRSELERQQILEQAWYQFVLGKNYDGEDLGLHLSWNQKDTFESLRPVVLRLYFKDVLKNKDIYRNELLIARDLLPVQKPYLALRQDLAQKAMNVVKSMQPPLSSSSSMHAAVPPARPSRQRPRINHTSTTGPEPEIDLRLLMAHINRFWLIVQVGELKEKNARLLQVRKIAREKLNLFKRLIALKVNLNRALDDQIDDLSRLIFQADNILQGHAPKFLKKSLIEYGSRKLREWKSFFSDKWNTYKLEKITLPIGPDLGLLAWRKKYEIKDFDKKMVNEELERLDSLIKFCLKAERTLSMISLSVSVEHKKMHATICQSIIDKMKQIIAEKKFPNKHPRLKTIGKFREMIINQIVNKIRHFEKVLSNFSNAVQPYPEKTFI